MKKSYILSSVVLVLLLSSNALAQPDDHLLVDVPFFTPWGALLTALGLGISGAYNILKRRK
ncbi:MAG TPA: hypothetical protein VFG09_08635 [Thermodesulfovibrionales bacterium]|nr:hypothetical protein [Thermodesulfovibrionales bacterium]